MKKLTLIRSTLLILTITTILTLSACSLFERNEPSPTPLITSDITPTATPESTPGPTEEVHTATPGITPTPTPYYSATKNPNPTATPTPVPAGMNIVNPFAIYNSGTLEHDILSLSARYSEILQYEVFGKSYMGKDLYVLKLGKGNIKFLVTGTTHARENITTNYIMRTIEEYAQAYIKNQTYEGINVHQLLEQVTIFYVPAVNPDGMDIVNLLKDPIDNPEKSVFKNIDNYQKVTWKANARGVDLNKNYPYFFDEVIKRNPTKFFASMDYHGPYPVSEPESYALMNLSEKHAFEFCINLHTKGKIMFWRDEGNGVIEGDEKLAKLINKQTGYTMNSPTVSPLSYGAGHENWFRYRYKKPAICLELTAGNDGPIPYNLVNRVSYDLKEYDYYSSTVLDWSKTKTLMLILARDYFEIK